MWVQEPVLYHSQLSAAMNLKLISAREVVDAVEQAYRDGLVPLASAEGYIRQVLGWREYVRGVYWTRMPEYAELNDLQATLPLPSVYWGADTRMACIKEVVGQTLRLGYAHHIQRLMVTGLFALLAGLLAVLSPCLLQLTVYYTFALAGMGVSRETLACLLDIEGEIVHQWELPDWPANYARLLPNGNLLAAHRLKDNRLPFNGIGGRIVELDWNGKVVWEYTDTMQHHDFHRSANGNTLYLAWERLSDAAAGRVRGGPSRPRSPAGSRRTGTRRPRPTAARACGARRRAGRARASAGRNRWGRGSIAGSAASPRGRLPSR